MKYITPEEVITYIPNEIRNSSAKEDLVTFIIRGYQSLDIPQDKNYENILIELGNSHNYVIPTDIKYIHSVSLLNTTDECADCTELITVYPNNVKSTYCKDLKLCTNCDLQYTIVDEIIKLPALNSNYLVTVNKLYSDNLKIVNNIDVIEFLKYYVMHEVVLNRSLTNDVSINLLDRISQQMNMLYSKARGSGIMKSINLRSQKLERTTFNIDEFNHRHSTVTPTRR